MVTVDERILFLLVIACLFSGSAAFLAMLESRRMVKICARILWRSHYVHGAERAGVEASIHELYKSTLAASIERLMGSPEDA